MFQQQQNPGGDWEYPIQDGIGNVRAMLDINLNPLESRQYSPIGEPFGLTGTNQTPFGFTGEPTDTNGLVHLRARYYNPTIGQFFNLDPLEGDITQPMSLDRYAYVQGNVVNAIDPSGMVYDNPNVYNSCGQSFFQGCAQEDFPYGQAERQAVADYASSSSRNNFAKYLRLRTGDKNTGFDPRKVTDSGPTYSIRNQVGVSTGSALFISDSLFFGANFPMTKVWYTQPSGSGQYNPSSAWANHPELRDFLKAHGAQDRFQYFVNPSSDTFVVNEGGKLNINNPQPLLDFIKMIQSVRKGDYFQTGEPATHGALVVGWGPLKDCGAVTDLEEAGTPDLLVDASNFSSYGTPIPGLLGMLVPYVTDSNYATDVQTGIYSHTQDPRPRPLYCLKATTVNRYKVGDKLYNIYLNPAYFNDTPWHFVVMPDNFHVPCNEQIPSTLSRPTNGPTPTRGAF